MPRIAPQPDLRARLATGHIEENQLYRQIRGLVVDSAAAITSASRRHDPEDRQGARRFSAPAAGPGWRAATMHPGLTGTSDPECYELVVGALGPDTP